MTGTSIDVTDAAGVFRDYAERLLRMRNDPLDAAAATRELDSIAADLAYLLRDCREAGLFPWYGCAEHLPRLMPRTRLYDEGERAKAAFTWDATLPMLANRANHRIPGGLTAGGSTMQKVGDGYRFHRDPTRWRTRAEDYAAACRFLADEGRSPQAGDAGGGNGREAAGGDRKHGKKRGRPRVTGDEAKDRRKLLDDWEAAKANGEHLKDFAENQNYDYQELRRRLDWARKNPG